MVPEWSTISTPSGASSTAWTRRVASTPSLTGVTARGTKNGEPAGTGDLGLVPAELGEVPLRIAQLVAPYGERVRAGDRIIAGALWKPIEVAPGDEIRAEIPPLGRVAVRIA